MNVLLHLLHNEWLGSWRFIVFQCKGAEPANAFKTCCTGHLLLETRSAIADLLIAPLPFRVAALGLAYLAVAVAVGLAVALIAGPLLRSQNTISLFLPPIPPSISLLFSPTFQILIIKNIPSSSSVQSPSHIASFLFSPSYQIQMFVYNKIIFSPKPTPISFRSSLAQASKSNYFLILQVSDSVVWSPSHIISLCFNPSSLILMWFNNNFLFSPSSLPSHLFLLGSAAPSTSLPYHLVPKSKQLLKREHGHINKIVPQQHPNPNGLTISSTWLC